MDETQILLAYGTALASAGIAALVCRRWFLRKQAELQSKLERSEQERLAAVERSTQTRSQLLQLSADLERLRTEHLALKTKSERRDEVERLVAAEYASSLAMLPRRDAPPVFADTQPMTKL